MADASLLAGERVIMTSVGDALSLTNFRVKYESNGGGISSYKSIPLGKVSCCAVTTKNYPFLLVVAAMAGLGMLGLPSDQGRVVCGVVAFVCVLAFFFLRTGQLEVISDSGSSIAVPTKGLKHEEVRRFAEAVSSAITSPQIVNG